MNRHPLVWFQRQWASGAVRLPASTFVIVYLFLLLCIPSQLIIRQIGAPGTPANLWGILALLWWVLTTLGGKNPVQGVTPVRVTFGLLTLTVLASYIAGNVAGWYSPADIHQATDEQWTLVTVSAEQLNTKMVSAADRGLLSFAGWGGIVLMTAEGIRSQFELDRVTNWAVGLGTFVASLGIVQYFTGYDIAALFTIPGLSANSDFGVVSARSVLNRVSSTAVHPIEFGVLLAAVLLLALHRSLHGTSLSLVSRWLPTAVIGVALPMSVSRSAILAAGIGVMVLFISWPSHWRLRALVAAPFAVVGIRLLAPGLVGTIRSLFSNIVNDPSISGRTDDYDVVLSVYAEHALLGRGLFTFIPRYYRILDNQFLGSLVELGAVGLVVLIVFLLIGFCAARSARHQPEARAAHLALAISGALAGVVLSFATFDALGFPIVAGLTFVLVGMAHAARRIGRQERLTAGADAGAPLTLAERA